MALATTASPLPVHLCGRKIETARHACCFFSSRDEEYAVIAPYVREGLEQGERVVQIVGRDLVRDHDARLERAGVPTRAARESGQYQVVASEDAYLEGGRFDPDRTLKMLETLVAERAEMGYPQLRAAGDMEWALSGREGTERLLEYETRVNMVTRGYHDSFVCFYDVHLFDAPTLIDVMRTHPAVVIGGVFHENPFFVPPERMLREIQARKPRRAAL